MKLFVVVVLFLGFGLSTQAQEIIYGGVTYKVKGKTILRDKENVTNTLSLEDQVGIMQALEHQKVLKKEQQIAEKALKDAEREQKAAEKKIKEAEKAQRTAEKKQKAAEKELKQKQRAQSKFEGAGDDYNDAVKKYERLRDKGKLSPNDEEKWLKKIDGLREDIEKTRRKL